MGLYFHLITMKVVHSYLTFVKRVFQKKKSAFYLHFGKIAGLGLKIAIFSKTAIFAISKKLIIWNKNIELYMINNQIWYDLEDWFKCF